MLPAKIIFSTRIGPFSGAGHIKRLIAISKSLPDSIEKHFFGDIEIDWVSEMLSKEFKYFDSKTPLEGNELVILDSYDKEFCLLVFSKFMGSRIIQLADRYTFLLPETKIIFMDLPFSYDGLFLESRVVAHGIEYLPTRKLIQESKLFEKQAKRVLVTTGGQVNAIVFSNLLREIAKQRYSDIRFELIGPTKSPYLYRPHIGFHDFGGGFDFIAQSCDTAISAAGTTMWDLFANRKLVGLAATVENQRANFDYAIRTGQAIEVFDSKTLKLDVGALQSLLFDSNVRHSLYSAISGKYDFDGARRVSEVILENF